MEEFVTLHDFIQYWDEIHKEPELQFQGNPWVWVIKSKMIKSLKYKPKSV